MLVRYSFSLIEIMYWWIQGAQEGTGKTELLGWLVGLKRDVLD